jgi:transposase InsO family protein
MPTTGSKRAARAAARTSSSPENWLAKVPEPDRSDQVWVADITYIETKEGWLYLAAIMVLFSRKIVGWNTASDLSTPLVTRAWDKAWNLRCPSPGRLHPSDRGCQYASSAFRAVLGNHGAAASMSRKVSTCRKQGINLRDACFQVAIGTPFVPTLPESGHTT